MKEATKKNIPLIIAVLIVGGLILTVMISIMVTKLRQDWDGFGEDLTTLLKHYQAEDFKYEDDIYKVFLPGDKYSSLSVDEKMQYCKNIYQGMQNFAVKHKIIKPLDSLLVRFYADGRKVADVVANELTLY